MTPNDILSWLTSVGVPAHYVALIGGWLMTACGIAATVQMFAPPPAAVPTTTLGKVWKGVYPLLTWLAANRGHARNAETVIKSTAAAVATAPVTRAALVERVRDKGL